MKNFQMVESMLKQHQTVYVKPVFGSQGRRIIRISRTGGHSFTYQYQIKDRLVKKTVYQLAELERKLKPLMGKLTYIIQQEIKLLKNQGSVVDMRVMVQKNERGKWGVSGKAFRIGKTGGITSNLSNGGKACEIQGILAQHFHDPLEVERIVREVDFLALAAAQSIEKYRFPIGELGIDIGVDQDGRIWFIEANLKPARKVFSLIGDQETRLLTVQRPILFARYLAGF
jgi:glutathione synthase/RimK-type ligase-like ATP-grasp enzyme